MSPSSGYGGGEHNEWHDPKAEVQREYSSRMKMDTDNRTGSAIDDRGSSEAPRSPQIQLPPNVNETVRQHAVVLCSAASDVERQRALDELKRRAETDDAALSAVLQFQAMKDAGMFTKKFRSIQIT